MVWAKLQVKISHSYKPEYTKFNKYVIFSSPLLGVKGGIPITIVYRLHCLYGKDMGIMKPVMSCSVMCLVEGSVFSWETLICLMWIGDYQ